MRASDDHTGASGERDDFVVLLPLVGGAPTHAAELRGDESALLEVLEAAVQSGGNEVTPLLTPVDESSVGEWADVLNSFGCATVQSIDPVPE